MTLAHPVIAGYDGSSSARNALAYAAGLARRLDRPLLVVYVTSPGVYCEPLTGQVVGLLRDADALERWLLTELDQVTDPGELEVHVRTRRGNPARELAAMASEFSADALVIGAPRRFWHHLAARSPAGSPATPSARSSSYRSGCSLPAHRRPGRPPDRRNPAPARHHHRTVSHLPGQPITS